MKLVMSLRHIQYFELQGEKYTPMAKYIKKEGASFLPHWPLKFRTKQSHGLTGQSQILRKKLNLFKADQNDMLEYVVIDTNSNIEIIAKLELKVLREK